MENWDAKSKITPLYTLSPDRRDLLPEFGCQTVLKVETFSYVFIVLTTVVCHIRQTTTDRQMTSYDNSRTLQCNCNVLLKTKNTTYWCTALWIQRNRPLSSYWNRWLTLGSHLSSTLLIRDHFGRKFIFFTTSHSYCLRLTTQPTQCPEKRGHVMFDYNSRLSW